MRAVLFGLAVAVWVATALPTADPLSKRELSGEVHTVEMPQHREATDWLAQLSSLSAAHPAAAAPSSPLPSGNALVMSLMHTLSASTTSPTATSSAPSHASPLAALLNPAAPAGTPTGGHAATDPLVTAVMAAALMAPKGFQVLADPALLKDTAIRDPILWHVLSNRNVQREILAKADEYADTIVLVIGEPEGLDEEQKQSFVQATENAIARSLERDSLNLLINDHEYVR
jgi:hypothetical protein